MENGLNWEAVAVLELRLAHPKSHTYLSGNIECKHPRIDLGTFVVTVSHKRLQNLGEHGYKEDAWRSYAGKYAA